MAHGMTPRLSPSLHNHNSHNANQPIPQSKRDKKRMMLSDKMSDMISSFSNNQIDHYYAQLSAVQCDINLVMRADPYANTPLDDSSEEVANLVSNAREELATNKQTFAEAENSFTALGGQYYSKFVDEVNTAMEIRDRDLTSLYNRYQNTVDELRRTNQYKIQLAHEEHALLTSTIRDRLIQSVTQKRIRLLKDKESLDIVDSSSLLLNPSQFSIGNPGSPSGTQSRKTRNTRGRPGDNADEAGANSTVESVNKRKRKAAFEDNDNDSPVPPSKTADTILPLLRDSRSKQIHTQFEAPLYSLDRLFSDKELAMNINRAHIATAEYFSRLRAQGIESRLHAATNNAAIAAINNAHNGDDAIDSTEVGQDADAEGNDAAAQTAQTTHATRSSQRGNVLSNPLSDLANAATATLPPYAINISTAASKSNPCAPAPPGLSDSEVQTDLALMRRGIEHPQYERLIESCCQNQGPAGMVTGNASWIGDMYAEPIVAGNGIVVDHPATVAMARQISGLGGVAMSKTASQISER